MGKRWERPARLLDRVQSSPPLLAAALVTAAVVAVGGGLLLGNVLNSPQPTQGVKEEEQKDDPEGFAAWLFGGEDEQSVVDQYLEAERLLRAQLAAQALLEQQGDDRALVLKGLGAVAQPWTWLGPRNWGGRTRAFVIHPTDPNVMLAGGITGGVWRSENRGASWLPLTDTFSNIAINVLEIDPSNPLIVYAGTGEAYYRFWPRHRGNGIMKSTDGGINWAFLEATTTNDAFDWVGDIEVSHRDPSRVYAANGTGVWVSTDGGASWGAGPVLAAGGEVGCQELAIRSDRDPDVVFASCGHDQSPDGAYRSTDAGVNWERVLPSGGESIGVVSLAIAPSDQNLIYASVSDRSGNALGLFASTGEGASGTWELRSSPASGAPNWSGYCRFPKLEGQGGYVTSLGVDPVDPNRLWIGGIDLFRSEDGGRSMRLASDWNLDPVDGTPYVHADQHAVVFDPGYDGTSNKTVYFAHDGGLSRTEDDRATIEGGCRTLGGIQYDSVNNGYGIAQFVGGSVSSDGRIVIGGTQDNGTFRLDVDGPSDWVSIWGGDGGHSAMEPAGEWLVVSTYYGAFYRLTGEARTQRCSADADCADIGFLGDPKVDGDELDSMEFYPPLEQGPNDVLWAAGRRIWRSTDVGANWVNVGSVGADIATTIGLSVSDPNTAYVGTYSGPVYRSSDATAAAPTWSRIDAAFPATYISSIAVDPADPSTVFVAFKTFEGQQLWRSVGGGPFEPVDGGLPETPVNAVAVNPRNSAMVYAGTDVGVFESLDGGITWRVANENLATTIVSRLVFRTGTSELYAFTFGRGAYRVDVGDDSPPLNDLITAAKDAVLAPEYRDTIDIRSASTAADDPSLSCGSALAPAQTRSVWYRLAPSEAGSIAVTTEDSNFDTVVAVHAADAVGALTEVACNDDNAAAGGPSSLAFEAAAGTTYFIEVTRSAGSPTDTLANTLQLRLTRG